MKEFLLVPSCRQGNGTGHLRRAASLFLQLQEKAAVTLYLPCRTVSPAVAMLLEEGIRKEDIISGKLPEDREWDFIIVDKRAAEESEWMLWNKRGVLLGIDEGGPLRGRFPFLIDILPGVQPRLPANITDPSLMELPSSRKKQGTDPSGVLVTFGGEDPEGLTEKMASYLVGSGLFRPEEITIVEGPLFGKRHFPEGTTVLHAPPRLKEMLHQYKFVFTSFGLTAFEAAAAGATVILFNPSAYHRLLSRRARFFEVGVRRIRKKKLLRSLNHPETIFVPSTGTTDPAHRVSLPQVLLSLEKPALLKCPLCGADRSAAGERFSDRTFFTCPACGIHYLVSFAPGRQSYRKDYFFSDYKNQYGRTYLEDFGYIRRISAGRLKIIAKIAPGRDLLDVGCAYGPFVKEALDSGWRPAGVELVKEAAEYVTAVLGIPVIQSSFETAVIERQYDAVTMWFVLEHFDNPGRVLEKVNRIVKTNGIFAFSTPNSSGITGKSRRRLFFRQSPRDHVTIWNPSSARNSLRSFGFRVVKVRVTGHHPERFPGIFKGTSGGKRKLMLLVSRLLRLGDTFEVYAVKYKEYSP